MYTFLDDNRQVGFCGSIKLVLNCLLVNPNINEWYFKQTNPLYGSGNIWEKVTNQDPKVSENLSFINWIGGPNRVKYMEDGKIQSTDWILGYDTNERDKYESKDFISIFRSLIKEIKFKDEIYNDVNKNLHLINNDTIGVHVRLKSHLKYGHGANQESNLDIDGLINKIKLQNKKVFLISDEAWVYDKFIENLSDVTYFDTKNKYKDLQCDLGYISESEEEKYELLKNLLIEIHLLSKCSYLYLMNSNVSHIALFLADHFNYEFYDKNIIYH